MLRVTAFAFLLSAMMLMGCAAPVSTTEAIQAIEGGDFATVEKMLAGASKEPSVELFFVKARLEEAKGNISAAAENYKAMYNQVDQKAEPEKLAEKFPFLEDALIRHAACLVPFDKSRYGPNGYKQNDLVFTESQWADSSLSLLLADKLNPTGKANFLIGRMMLVYGDFTRAHWYLKKYLDYASDDPWANKLMGDVCVYYGFTRDENKEAPRFRNMAMNRYNMAIDYLPTEPSFLYARGVLKELSRDIDGALSDFRAVLNINPNYLAALLDIGIIVRDKGDEKAAMASFTKAMQLDPNFCEPHYHMAILYFGQKKFKLAEQSIDKALALNTTDPDYYALKGEILSTADGEAILSATFAAARPGVKAKETPGLIAARDAFSKAIELMPNTAGLYFKRGIVYLKMLRHSDAKEEFNKAIELAKEGDPDAFRYDMTVAFIYFVEKNHDLNIKHCSHMAELYLQNIRKEALENRIISSETDLIPIKQTKLNADFGCMIMFWSDSIDEVKSASEREKFKKFMGSFKIEYDTKPIGND